MSDLLTPLNRRQPVTKDQRTAYKSTIESLTNEQLLERYTGYAAGDDYGGEWTEHGGVIWDLLQEELRHRLTEWEFLGRDDGT